MQDVFQGRIFKTRSGAVLIGAAAAVLAAILLVVYLHSYRSSVNSGARPVTVLVAKSLIPRGTSGSLIAEQHLYQVTTVPKDQLQDLALVDPSALAGRATAVDVYPGQQLTEADFTTEGANSIPSQITGPNRAIAIPADAVHGVAGQIQAGDHIDIYVELDANGGPALKLLASNVLVLVPPTTSASSGVGGASNSTGSPSVLRVKTQNAGKFAFAVDHGQLWFVLRPQVGARPTTPTLVTSNTLLTSPAVVGG
jgi:Flp pilus assembly protein CpaB